jgi:hypothetical protein
MPERTDWPALFALPATNRAIVDEDRFGCLTALADIPRGLRRWPSHRAHLPCTALLG